ncbi:MAG: isoprenylcysteine carboxylmethyltransferase family protein [Chloroflexales bacterium]|nr:isoprenylcysteine carboxylmethyltransferase family protein [Chloroflexales bacterium]
MSLNVSHNKRPLEPGLKAGIAKRFVQIALTIALQAAIVFLAAGRFDWIWAWVFLGVGLLGIAVNSMFLLRYNPAIVSERARSEGMRDWDKVVGGLWAIMYFVGVLLVAGLDQRLGWTAPFPLVYHIVGAMALILGGALFSWALISNAYFATIARIQEDRGQTVCTSGPYRFVRHPGYIGAIVQSLGVPLMLGSLWAFIPGGLAALLIIARTALEDRMLQAELGGYKDYTQRVRYRLLPGVW